MALTVRILNANETRSTLLNQAQLDVVTQVMNMDLSKKKFAAEVLARLEAAELAPDFQDADSRPEIPGSTTPVKRKAALDGAFKTLERQFDGHPVPEVNVRGALNVLRYALGYPPVVGN